MVPARTAIDLGLRPCAHSDCPVCTPDDPVWPSNPLWAMACKRGAFSYLPKPFDLKYLDHLAALALSR